jgi:hypothetical protein
VSQPGARTALHACWLLKCVCNSLRQTQRRCWLQMAGCGLGVRAITASTVSPRAPLPACPPARGAVHERRRDAQNAVELRCAAQ